MVFLRKISRYVAGPLAALMMMVSMPMGLAQAALVGTDEVISAASADVERARLAAFVARQDVRERMQQMGVDPDEAKARIAGMSDSEISQVAARMDAMPAGQDATSVIISAVVLIFLVLLVTDLLGLTDVFPFVKGGRAR